MAFAAIEGLGLDRSIAEALYFDRLTGRWRGSGAGDWWAHGLLHDDGRWLVRGIAAAALATWALSWFLPSARRWRGPAGFIALAMVLSVAIVGALKAATNVDCPWDLAGFGGHQPYVPLFADRPDYLPRAQCFPGAHASSGFALVSGYFDSRQKVWQEPIYRNVFGLLEQFGDAEIASLIAPRALVIEHCTAPAIDGPPMAL